MTSNVAVISEIRIYSFYHYENMSLVMYSHIHGLGCQPLSSHSLQGLIQFYSHFCQSKSKSNRLTVEKKFAFFAVSSLGYRLISIYSHLCWSTSNSFLYFINSAWKDFIFSERVYTFLGHHVRVMKKLKRGLSVVSLSICLVLYLPRICVPWLITDQKRSCFYSVGVQMLKLNLV